MSTLAIWCRVVQSRDVRSRVFSRPIAEFEAARVEALQDKRARRKQTVHTGALACQSCPRICSSRIGLFAHMKTYPK